MARDRLSKGEYFLELEVVDGLIDADAYNLDGIMAFWICVSARREPLPFLPSTVTERGPWAHSPHTAL